MPSLARADYCENTDLGYSGDIDPSTVSPSDCEENDITVVDEGGDRVFVYESGDRIVFGMVFDFIGKPQRIQLSIDGEWRTKDGETIAEVSTGHDEVKDIGDGRYWTWWTWTFWLEDISSDYVGEDIVLDLNVDELVNGNSLIVDTEDMGTPARIKEEKGASIDDVKLDNTTIFT